MICIKTTINWKWVKSSNNILNNVYTLHIEACTSSVDVYVGAEKESRNDVL